MARFLLAWELGANLGHVTRFVSLARELKAHGHSLVFALRDVTGGRLIPAGMGPVVQAPLFMHSQAQTAWSMADILLSCGFDSARTLQSMVDAWTSLMHMSACDALIADHSPTALLAARVIGLPALHLGHGFSVPPRVSPLPLFRDWAVAPAGHAEHSDAQALAHVNQVLSAKGSEPLKQLCDLFYPERTVLCTWPELDHYPARDANAAYAGPDVEFLPGQAPQWPAGSGPRVFAYLRALHPQHTEVLQTLAQLGCATVCFFPDLAQAGSSLPQSPHIHYSADPLDLQRTLAEGCELVICHGGQATVVQSFLSGVPCLLLPMQAEQFMLARRADALGAAVNVAQQPQPHALASSIRQLLNADGHYRRAALAFAKQHQRLDATGLNSRVRQAAECLTPNA